MPKNYEINGDECLNSIAFENGFFWETLWNLPENAELKNKRETPNILKTGDVVFVPDLRPKELSKGVEQKHTFKKKGTPAKLRLQILEEPPPEDKPVPASSSPTSPALPIPISKNVTDGDPEVPVEEKEDKPRANVPYILTIDGKTTKGKTDGEGRVETVIPPNARQGELVLEPGTDKETIIPLKLGHLQPVSEISGVKNRLINLGFDCGDISDEETPNMSAALRAFQEKNSLKSTGEINQETRAKLKEIHGS